MSQVNEKRIAGLEKLFMAIMNRENVLEEVKRSDKLINDVTPSDIIEVVDRLVKMGIPTVDLKRGINKWLNILHRSLSNYPVKTPTPGSWINCAVRNNTILDQKLKALRPLVKKLNKYPGDRETIDNMTLLFRELQKHGSYYIIKENLLFPLLEKRWNNYGCLGIMWSFHDDIVKNISKITELLEEADNKEKILDLRRFNRLAGDIFFNMYAIRFREERILFPVLESTIETEEVDALFPESLEIGFPWYTPDLKGNPGASDSSPYSDDNRRGRHAVPDSAEHNSDGSKTGRNGGGKSSDDRRDEPTGAADNSYQQQVDLGTGSLSPEMISLLINHLPVDITFVDENDRVAYFSSPAKRIFTRTKGVLGRNVKNCHPPDSVHVVERIIEDFRNGTRSTASFWIDLKGEKVLINYFAVRDSDGKYRGVAEVTQEISAIQSLKGEKRILDY
jgi:PAS domain S-box-containing protein